jgi:hypothetical protein
MTSEELVQQKKNEAEARKKSEEWLAKIKAERAAKEKGEAVPKPAPAPIMRTWREATGTYTVRATLVDVVDGKVMLKKEDGRIVTVPLEKLSKYDQDYANRRAKSGKDKVANPFD